eukprot:447180-Amphidinium_carterae.1
MHCTIWIRSDALGAISGGFLKARLSVASQYACVITVEGCNGMRLLSLQHQQERIRENLRVYTAAQIIVHCGLPMTLCEHMIFQHSVEVEWCIWASGNHTGAGCHVMQCTHMRGCKHLCGCDKLGILVTKHL